MTPEEEFAEHAFAAGAMEDQHPATIRGSFAFFHPTSKIGSRTVVMPHAYIGPNVVVGEDCVIGPGASIGHWGFGYEEQEDGSWQYKTHTEGVIIGDRVHIGPSAGVAQGRHRPTRIGDGSKIDLGCHIAHNVVIGRNVLVIANAMVAGSVEIGDGAIVNPSACIRDHAKVGERAIVGMGAVVTKDVPAGEVWVGSPARFLRVREEGESAVRRS